MAGILMEPINCCSKRLFLCSDNFLTPASEMSSMLRLSLSLAEGFPDLTLWSVVSCSSFAFISRLILNFPTLESMVFFPSRLRGDGFCSCFVAAETSLFRLKLFDVIPAGDWLEEALDLFFRRTISPSFDASWFNEELTVCWGCFVVLCDSFGLNCCWCGCCCGCCSTSSPEGAFSWFFFILNSKKLLDSILSVSSLAGGHLHFPILTVLALP